MPRPLWILPSFLCLVAPSVATGWTLLLANQSATGAKANPADLVALFAAVWAIYLADRLHDGQRHRDLLSDDLAPRHDWARHHPRTLAALLFAALALGAAAAPDLSPGTWLAGGILAAATAAYFAVFRLTGWHKRLPQWLPWKEVGIAAVFTGGTAIAATGGSPLRVPASELAALLLLFTGNCLLIARAERSWDRHNDECAYFATERRSHRLPEICFLLAIGLSLLSLAEGHGEFTGAVSLGAVASIAVGRFAGRRSAQPLADAVLLGAWAAWMLSRGNGGGFFD